MSASTSLTFLCLIYLVWVAVCIVLARRVMDVCMYVCLSDRLEVTILIEKTYTSEAPCI